MVQSGLSERFVQGGDKRVIENSELDNEYRIRKLTPKECWRLMGFSDDAFEKAKAGDERFKKIIEDWGDEVARGVAEIALLFDPELILLGGAVAKQGEYLVDLVERHLEEYVPKGLIQTQIKVSHLANKAQLLGGIAELVNI